MSYIRGVKFRHFIIPGSGRQLVKKLLILIDPRFGFRMRVAAVAGQTGDGRDHSALIVLVKAEIFFIEDRKSVV